jgi:hypothetical protein
MRPYRRLNNACIIPCSVQTFTILHSLANIANPNEICEYSFSIPLFCKLLINIWACETDLNTEPVKCCLHCQTTFIKEECRYYIVISAHIPQAMSFFGVPNDNNVWFSCLHNSCYKTRTCNYSSFDHTWQCWRKTEDHDSALHHTVLSTILFHVIFPHFSSLSVLGLNPILRILVWNTTDVFVCSSYTMKKLHA